METRLPPGVHKNNYPFAPLTVDLGNGEVLSYISVGEGPCLLFSHGTPTWSYEWRHLILALSGQFRCIAVDHLGFGLSHRPAHADYSPEAHAARFNRFIAALGLTDYHLIVHDFGGPIALDEALTRSERVRSLTFFNTFAWAFGDTVGTRLMAWLASSWLFRWAYGALNLSFQIARSAWGDRKKLTPQTFEPYEALFPDASSRRLVLWALARSMRHSAPYFHSLWERRSRLSETPMHFIWGMKDSALPPRYLDRFLHAYLHASVMRLESAGHFPHEEEPEACIASVRSFLQTVAE